MNILITGAWGAAANYIEAIKADGHDIRFMQQESDTLPCTPEWPDAIICNGLFLHHAIQSFTRLKYIQLTSVGFDRVDMDYVRSNGITINNARGVYSIPMAEFALSQVLSLYKQTAAFEHQQRAGSWIKQRGIRELYSRSVVIIGCGSVGSECALRFKAMGCSVTGVDIIEMSNACFDEITTLDNLDTVIPLADILILTLPLTQQTRHMMDAHRLILIKDGAALVNIARGAIIDEAALIKELDRKRFDAILDVYDQEPLPADSPLWRMPNCHITPHNSFVGDGNAARLANVIMDNLGRYTRANGGQ